MLFHDNPDIIKADCETIQGGEALKRSKTKVWKNGGYIVVENTLEKDRIIRMVTEEKAEQVLSIYAPYVMETAVTFEYEVPSPAQMRERIRHTLEKYPWLAIYEEGEMAGYAYVSPFKERAAYDWAVETSIYIKKEYQGKGIGKYLYEELETILKKQHILNVNACIAWPNPQSVAFHERLGYRTAAHFTECGYKFGKWYDMIWMEKMLGEHQPEPEPFLPIGQLLEKTV